MSKPVLGRGLGHLLPPAGPANPAPVPPARETGAEGGVAKLLRGAPDRSPPGRVPPARRPAGPNPFFVFSLLAADAGLALAGVVIARQNPFERAPWMFLFGIALIGLGGWVGWLGWSWSKDHAPAPAGSAEDQFFKR